MDVDVAVRNKCNKNNKNYSSFFKHNYIEFFQDGGGVERIERTTR